jgi:DNA primase large subunit
MKNPAIPTRFTKNDLTKYPFLKENTEYIKTLNLKVEDLTSPEFSTILQRAEERLTEAILYANVTHKPQNAEIEISSFPVTIILTLATQNEFIKKRYALAEAKQTYQDLQLEPKERLLAIAHDIGWSLKLNTDPMIPHEYTLNFTDYLRNTTHLRDKKWKLVNRHLTKGKVYLTARETARILSEEVRKHMEKRLEIKDLQKLPQIIAETAEKIKKLAVEKIGLTEMEGLPKIIAQSAFPPCIGALYAAFTSGRHLSHIGRFTLTSFLVNIGMQPDAVVALFKNISDFNEKLTRYQVEHIAGDRGSRTRYIPPRCDTLKTHGVCTNPDALCRSINHPLTYYRIRLRRTR